MAWNAWKRCCKNVDSQGEHFTGIHDRFLRDPVYRESQLAIGWKEQQCKEWDELAQEDHTYRLTPEELRRYQGQWYLTLNKAGKNGLMKLRSEFRAAVLMKNRLHHESGEQVEEPIDPDQYKRWHPSSSTSWWDKSEWNWKWTYYFFNWSDFFLLQLVDSDPLWPTGECRQDNLTRVFSHLPSLHTIILCIPTAWLKTGHPMCLCARFIPSSCHPWCVFERCWSSFCPSLVSLRRLPLLFHTLPALCLAIHLQSRHRRGLKPLHSRTMRSIAPWRFSIVSHQHARTPHQDKRHRRNLIPKQFQHEQASSIVKNTWTVVWRLIRIFGTSNSDTCRDERNSNFFAEPFIIDAWGPLQCAAMLQLSVLTRESEASWLCDKILVRVDLLQRITCSTFFSRRMETTVPAQRLSEKTQNCLFVIQKEGQKEDTRISLSPEKCMRVTLCIVAFAVSPRSSAVTWSAFALHGIIVAKTKGKLPAATRTADAA